MSVLIRADKVPLCSSVAAPRINVWSASDQATIVYLLSVCQAPWQLFSISPILAFMQLKSTPTLRGNWRDLRRDATAHRQPCTLLWSAHSWGNTSGGASLVVDPPLTTSTFITVRSSTPVENPAEMFNIRSRAWCTSTTSNFSLKISPF